MITMIVMLKRRPDLTREQFRHHYENSHVMLAKKTVGYLFHDYRRNYVNSANHVTAESYENAAENEGFDVVTSITFKNQADCDEFFRLMADPKLGDLFREDENHFLDRSEMYIYLTEEVKTWTAADL